VVAAAKGAVLADAVVVAGLVALAAAATAAAGAGVTFAAPAAVPFARGPFTFNLAARDANAEVMLGFGAAEDAPDAATAAAIVPPEADAAFRAAAARRSAAPRLAAAPGLFVDGAEAAEPAAPSAGLTGAEEAAGLSDGSADRGAAIGVFFVPLAPEAAVEEVLGPAASAAPPAVAVPRARRLTLRASNIARAAATGAGAPEAAPVPTAAEAPGIRVPTAGEPRAPGRAAFICATCAFAAASAGLSIGMPPEAAPPAALAGLLPAAATPGAEDDIGAD